MKSKTKTILALLLCITLTFGTSITAAATEEPAESTQTTAAAAEEPAESAQTTEDESTSELKAELDTLQQEEVIVDNQLIVVAKDDEAFRESISESSEDTLIEVTDTNEDTIATIETTEDLAEKMAEFEADPNVEYVQPNFIYTLQDDITSLASTNDTRISEQWYLSGNVLISDAWNYVTTEKKIKVAVIDSGIQADHPDLSANISSKSYDFVADTASMTDSNGHGTHVAGIIAAVANNSIGIAGVSYNAELLCYRVTWKDSSGEETTNSTKLIQAYNQAVNDGARVINMSLGGYQTDNAMDITLLNAINAAESKGIVTVCAAGNKGTTSKCYPGDYEPCISVVATDASNSRASFSDYNECKDIAAPGVNILSTWVGSQYNNLSGTSMASPVVAGVVSLMLAADSSLTAEQVKNYLYNTATDLGTSGRDDYYGYGLVNAKAAVEKVIDPTNVSYETHIQDVGWQTAKKNGETSGTTGQCKRLEGIKISVYDSDITGSIEYKTHIQDVGWQAWKKDGDLSGTTGQCKRLEAIRIRLTGNMAAEYDVYYRVHAENYGWMDWAKNGDAAGTAGYAYRLEAIQIKLVEKGGAAPGSTAVSYRAKTLVSYQTHVQDIGWQGIKYDGTSAGTTGQRKRIEGIKISLISSAYDGSIQYKTHVETNGWGDWTQNGSMSGTTGQCKRLEAIQIKLTGEMAEKYDIYYRVHAQEFGWMGWAKNGASAGTSGYAYRLEAIQIKLVAKGGAAPGSTATPYRSK